MPDIEVAETIVSAGQNLMQVAVRHRDLAADSSLEIEQAFKQLIEAIQNDRRISEVIDPTFIDDSSDALCTQVFNVDEIKQILECIAGITACALKWSAERHIYDQAERAYLAAAVTQRTELSNPMQESLARLNSIKSECNLIVERIKTFIETRVSERL
jgi:hypothetical protein